MSDNDQSAADRERQRIGEIEALAASPSGADAGPEVKELLAAAIAQGTSADEFSAQLLKLLRASRARPVSTQPHGGGAPPGDLLLECSLALTCGLAPQRAERAYGERVVDAAQSARWRGMNLHGLLRHWAAKAGRGGRTGRFTDEDIRAAFRADADLAIRAEGPSTLSLPNLLANVMGKLLLESYEAVGTVWEKFCKEDLAKDFKPMSRIRLTGQGTFRVLPPQGEIKNIGLAEEALANQLHTEAAIIAIDRQMLINDDLAGLSNAPRLLGRQGALAIERGVFTLLLSNPSNFFGAGNKNLNTGTGSALSSTSLSTARQKMREQKDINGDPILVEPIILLVPPALETTADALVNSTLVVGTTTTDKPLPNANPWTAQFDVITSPYLGVAGAPAGQTGSDTGWYVAAGPGDFAMMSVAFLNGMRQPTIESAAMEFDTLGISMRAYLDLGVNMLDFRGAQKNVGA
jgi:hypothetical protein